MTAMSHEEILSPHEPALARATRFGLIVALFLVIGPFIGGLTVWCIALFFAAVRGAVGRAGAWFELLPILMILAYKIGAPVAAVAGFVHAIAAIRLNKTNLLVPFFAALIAIAAFLIAGVLLMGVGEIVLLSLVVVPASFVASFVCWRTARGLLRAS